MKDHITEASMDLDTKSAFVCLSCGHPNDIKKAQGHHVPALGTGVKDRFSEAVKESGEKSAFTCESCGEKQRVSSSSKH